VQKKEIIHKTSRGIVGKLTHEKRTRLNSLDRRNGVTWGGITKMCGACGVGKQTAESASIEKSRRYQKRTIQKAELKTRERCVQKTKRERGEGGTSGRRVIVTRKELKQVKKIKQARGWVMSVESWGMLVHRKKKKTKRVKGKKKSLKGKARRIPRKKSLKTK